MTKTNCDCPNTDPARGANLVDLYKAYTEALIEPKCDSTPCEEKFNEHLYATYRFAVANIDLNCLRTLSAAQITCLIGKLDLYSDEMLKDVPALTCVDPCDEAFSAYLTPLESGMVGTILASSLTTSITVTTTTSTLTAVNPSNAAEWENGTSYKLPCSKEDGTCSDANRTYSAVITANISHSLATNPTNMTLSINGISSDDFPVPVTADTNLSHIFKIENIPCDIDISSVTANINTAVDQDVTVTIYKITFTSESEC